MESTNITTTELFTLENGVISVSKAELKKAMTLTKMLKSYKIETSAKASILENLEFRTKNILNKGRVFRSRVMLKGYLGVIGSQN